MVQGQALFEQVVAATRIPALVAPFVVRRVCARRGVLARELTAEALAGVLPDLEGELALHLGPEELARAREALRALCAWTGS